MKYAIACVSISYACDLNVIIFHEASVAVGLQRKAYIWSQVAPLIDDAQRLSKPDLAWSNAEDVSQLKYVKLEGT